MLMLMLLLLLLLSIPCLGGMKKMIVGVSCKMKAKKIIMFDEGGIRTHAALRTIVLNVH